MNMIAVLKYINVNFPKLKKPLWRTFYNFMGRQESNKKIQFMNYGIVLDPMLDLEPEDMGNVFRIQLYHRLTSKTPVNGMDVMEIGCGRGGGCSYYHKYLSPKTMLGIDLSKQNIKICKEINTLSSSLNFEIGDAENLSQSDNSKDIILNLESAHCYPNFGKFSNESYRVLRPGGFLCFADFILKEDIPEILDQFKTSGFKIIEKADLSKDVVKAIKLDNKRSEFKETNRIFKINLRKLTGAEENSDKGLVKMFTDGSLVHLHILLQK